MGDARDKKYMAEALALAARGAGDVAPNPLVGCVLVKNDAVVGRGWHKRVGGPHAEVEAIADAGDSAAGSTAYVTLEPCNHKGRTGPCTQALLRAGIREVVFALADPTPEAGGGGAFLEKEGVLVRRNVLEQQARDQNRFWLHALETGRPYLIAKFAASLDGKIATHTGDSKWITGEIARERAHELRRQVDAIIVGANTVIADDPSLTARTGTESYYPLRVVLDSTARSSPGAKVFERSGRGAILATTNSANESDLNRFREHGVEVLMADPDQNGRPDPGHLLNVLRNKGLNSVMVEGGGETIGAFHDAGLIDEVWAFIAPVLFGGAGPSPVSGDGINKISHALRLADAQTEILGNDLLVRGRIPRKEVA